MKLTFEWTKVQELIDKTKEAKTFRARYGDNTGPGLWLVGDAGVYLMSNMTIAEDEKPAVVYARECNPDTMPFDGWWSAKQDTFGRDDGVEFLALADMEKFGQIRPMSLSVDFSGGQMVFEAVAESSRRPVGPKP